MSRVAAARAETPVKTPVVSDPIPSLPDSSRMKESVAHAHFATHGSHGILDLGASKTVISSDHLPELILSLETETRRGLTRCACNITFRFGNQAVDKPSCIGLASWMSQTEDSDSTRWNPVLDQQSADEGSGSTDQLRH